MTTQWSVLLLGAILVSACDHKENISSPVASAKDTTAGGLRAMQDAAVTDGAVAPTYGCVGTNMLHVPLDPASPGPWPVGVRTVQVAGFVTEVWYPAEPGSEAGKAVARFDLRETLPRADRTLIHDDDERNLVCNCVRDLPLDITHGPYPLIVFVHGYSLTRIQSVSLLAHLASRGFVVASSDYPGATTDDVMSRRPFTKPASMARKALAALRSTEGELAFLRGRLDVDRVGLIGFSMGGPAVAALADVDAVEVVINMAEKGTPATGHRFSTLVMGGQQDTFEPYGVQVQGYEDSPTPKRLVGIAGAGHLVFSDLCAVSSGQGGFMGLALTRGVKMRTFVARLSATGCAELTAPYATITHVVAYATTAALEEQLMCSTAATAAFDQIETLAAVGEYREER